MHILLLIFFTLATNALAQTTKSPSPNKQIPNSGFADIVEELIPTVVNISATQEVSNGNAPAIDQTLLNDLQKTPLFEEFNSQLLNSRESRKKISSIGSGFIISKDGFIATNVHVIEEADEINVNLSDGSKYKAKIVGIDKKTDLALLKINPEKELKFVKFGDSTKSRIGDWTIVIGNPYGLGGSVSVGIISARSRDISNSQAEEFIQTDAAINKGNSGGPMFNVKGEVIGITTAIYSPSGGSVGIGFATPSSTANQVIKQLREQGEVSRAWIGVSIQEMSDEMAEGLGIEKTQGAFVTDITNNGPAQKAGMLPADVIVKFNEQEINDTKALPKAVAKTPIGKIVKVVVFRKGKVKILELKVEKMRDENVKKTDSKSLDKKLNKPSTSLQILGLGLTETNPQNKVKGLLVTDVNPKSEAAEKGILSGDIILSVNQAALANVEEFKKSIEDAKKGNGKLFLFLKRGDGNYGAVLQVR
jgi:serine protease Do